jgi:hypothetical protein
MTKISEVFVFFFAFGLLCNLAKSDEPIPEEDLEKYNYSKLQVNWELRGFNAKFVRNAHHGKLIRSHDFEMTVGEIKTKWRLQLYPAGVGDYRDCIGIFIQNLDESSSDFELFASFSIMNGAEEVHHQQLPDFRKAIKIDVGEGRGFRNFISHEDFFKREEMFIVNSEMMVRVQVILRTPRLRELYLFTFV